jgi:hypothetical protein
MIYYAAVKLLKPLPNANLTGKLARAMLHRIDSQLWTVQAVAQFSSVTEAVAAQRALNRPPAISAQPTQISPQRYTGPRKPFDPQLSLSEFVASLIADPSKLKKVALDFERQGHSLVDMLEQAGVDLEQSSALAVPQVPSAPAPLPDPSA